MGIVLCIIVVFAAFSSYFYWRSDNAVGPNLITAFVGVALSAVITLVLLNGQTKDEEDKDRNIKMYSRKLNVFAKFNQLLWEEDGIENEDLRKSCLKELIFYLNEKEIESLKTYANSLTDFESPIQRTEAKAKITNLLRNSLEGESASNTKIVDAIISLNDILAPENAVKQIEEKSGNSEAQYLQQQAWHFIMWDERQNSKLKEGFKELSLVEYDEDWRTNLVKQVGENDIVMLFRRGGYGYVGAYKAIGWRVFYFEENKEELQMFDKEKQVITGEQYLSDIKTYDIYNSKEDGATTCANIIVEPIAFVENGVGNPGGVYRRTISRYDSHYAWLLMERFKNAITNNA